MHRLTLARRSALLLTSFALLPACGGSSEVEFTTATGSSTAAGSGGNEATTGTAGSGGSGGAGSDGGGGSAAVCEGLSKGAGDHNMTVMSSGEERSFIVHAPAGYDNTKPTLVILTFHGYLESASQIDNITKMNAVSEAHNVLVVYPQGKSSSWNAGACCGTSASQGAPDVQFVSDMLDGLQGEFCVDPRRVFASGFSNGGMLSHRLACELSDRIAAIGGVSGTMAIDSCAPPRPVPVIHFHGTSDFVVPYGGGGLGGAQSVDATIAGWVTRNGCTDATPKVVYQQGDATCEEYSQCQAGATVRRCTIDEGGHQWPGGESAGPAGKVSMDISASEELHTFFAAHPMP